MTKGWGITRLSAVALLGACGALAQTAAKPADAKRQGAPATAPAPAKASGIMVFVDPTTRQIRQPDASEIGTLGSASQSSTAAVPPTAPRTIQGTGGAVGLLLDDSAMSFMVATRKSDGKLDVECVTGAGEAASRVGGIARGQSATSAGPGAK